jgi:hypothetical protein
MENLYVFVDEYKEVKGIYEEDEIGEFFNDYLIELTTEIEEHYTIGEQLEMHLNVLGVLSKYYDIMNINFDKDIREYIALYNMIAPNRLVFEKVEDVEEDEIQDIIEYINKTKDGWNKFKKNNYEIPTQTIVLTKPDKETPNIDSMKITTTLTENNVEEMLTDIIKSEIYGLAHNYNSLELMFDKTDYLRDLLDICYEMKNGTTTNINLLKEFQEIYNNEHMLANQEITIDYI